MREGEGRKGGMQETDGSEKVNSVKRERERAPSVLVRNVLSVCLSVQECS